MVKSGECVVGLPNETYRCAYWRDDSGKRMKLFLVALLSSFVLVVAWIVADSILSTIYYDGMLFFSSEGPIYFPLRLPRTVYTIVAPDLIQNAAAGTPGGPAAERLLFFAFNVLLYSIPIYLVLSLLFKGRKKASN